MIYYLLDWTTAWLANPWSSLSFSFSLYHRKVVQDQLFSTNIACCVDSYADHDVLYVFARSTLGRHLNGSIHNTQGPLAHVDEDHRRRSRIGFRLGARGQGVFSVALRFAY